MLMIDCGRCVYESSDVPAMKGKFFYSIVKSSVYVIKSELPGPLHEQLELQFNRCIDRYLLFARDSTGFFPVTPYACLFDKQAGSYAIIWHTGKDGLFWLTLRLDGQALISSVTFHEAKQEAEKWAVVTKHPRAAATPVPLDGNPFIMQIVSMEAFKAFQQFLTNHKGQYKLVYKNIMKRNTNVLPDAVSSRQKGAKKAVTVNDRGVVAIEKGDNVSALEYFNRAIRLDPSYAEAYGNRGIAYGSQGKWDLALDDLNRAILLNPRLGKLYYDRGLAFASKRLYDSAIADYTKAISLEPLLADIYLGRGAVYANTRRLDEAISDFNQALRLDPVNVEALHNRGQAYSELREWDLAMADFDEALRLNPRDVNAYFLRGNAFTGQGEWELALEEYDEVIRLDPCHILAYVNCGTAYVSQSEWELALENYNQAISLDPKCALAYAMRGNVYYGQDKPGLARAEWERALRIDPNCAAARDALGRYGEDWDDD